MIRSKDKGKTIGSQWKKNLPIAITSQIPSRKLYISMIEWTVFLQYLVPKSKSVVKLHGIDDNNNDDDDSKATTL